MLDAALLLAFCLLMGLLSFGIVAWIAVSGQLLLLDNILLVLIALTIGGIFMGIFAWSVKTGEAREILKHLRNRSNKGGESDAAPPA
jgi:uncharacterized membrane protein